MRGKSLSIGMKCFLYLFSRNWGKTLNEFQVFSFQIGSSNQRVKHLTYKNIEKHNILNFYAQNKNKIALLLNFFDYFTLKI